MFEGARDRIMNIVGGQSLRQTRARARAFETVSRNAPAYIAGLLREFDPHLYDTVQQLMRYDLISEMGSRAAPNDSMRLREVELSRHAYAWDLAARRMVEITTDFGLGRQVRITTPNEMAQEVWKEFATAKRNRPVMNDVNLMGLSHRLCTDGEFFLAHWISTVDGQDTVRVFYTDEIGQFIAMPNDPLTVLLYGRMEQGQTRYYRSWMASDEQIETLEGKYELVEQKDTEIVIQHVRLPGIQERGWPLLTAATGWTEQYERFLGDRAALSKAVASMVNKYTVKGGSRAVDEFKSLLRSSLVTSGYYDRNPAPVAGADFVANEGVQVDRMPLSTAAGDARFDGLQMVGHMGLGAVVPPMWLGRPDALQNRSTAEISMMPSLAWWSTYNGIWAQAFRDELEIVLKAKERYDGVDYGEEVENINAEFSSSTMWQLPLKEFIEALGAAVGQGLLRAETAVRVIASRPELALDDPDAEVEAWSKGRQERTIPDEAAAVVEAAARMLSR